MATGQDCGFSHVRALIFTLLCLCALAGCAVGGPLSVPSEAKRADIAPIPVANDPLPMQQIPASGNSTLAMTAWQAQDPRGVILALHGFGDYGPSTFSQAASYWTKRGLSVYAPDQRGFGRNVSRGAWPGVDTLIADAVVMSQTIRKWHPCLPLIVLGHSMGGGVTLAAAAHGLEADGIILAAPAIWGGRELNSLKRVLAWSAAAMVPDARFSGRGIVRIQASDNIPMLRALGADPLYLSPPSAREMIGLVRLLDRAAAAAPHVNRPALMLLGAKDQIVPPDAAQRVFAAGQGERTVITFPDGWHMLFRDLHAEQVLHTVADWVLARAPSWQRRACAG